MRAIIWIPPRCMIPTAGVHAKSHGPRHNVSRCRTLPRSRLWSRRSSRRSTRPFILRSTRPSSRRSRHPGSKWESAQVGTRLEGMGLSGNLSGNCLDAVWVNCEWASTYLYVNIVGHKRVLAGTPRHCRPLTPRRTRQTCRPLSPRAIPQWCSPFPHPRAHPRKRTHARTRARTHARTHKRARTHNLTSAQ